MAPLEIIYFEIYKAEDLLKITILFIGRTSLDLFASSISTVLIIPISFGNVFTTRAIQLAPYPTDFLACHPLVKPRR